jgi:hypothetical protein
MAIWRVTTSIRRRASASASSTVDRPSRPGGFALPQSCINLLPASGHRWPAPPRRCVVGDHMRKILRSGVQPALECTRSHTGLGLRPNLGDLPMMLRIDSAFAAAFAVCLVCAFGGSAHAQSVGGDGKQKVAAGSHTTSAAPRPYSDARGSFAPQYAWGAPPRQDPRDAWHGYFANPIDNPNYHGLADRR